MMKKVAWFALLLVEITIGMSHQIYLSPGVKLGDIEVCCEAVSRVISIGDKVDFGIGIMGSWDGGNFIISGNENIGLQIMSKDIPVIFDALCISECKAYVPELHVIGETNIDKLRLDVSSRNMNIIGVLTTALLDVSGAVTINGQVNFLNNGLLKMRGMSTKDELRVYGAIIAPENFTIDTRQNYCAGIINEGTISFGSGIFLVNRFINGTGGIVNGEIARFQVNDTLQNYGEFSVLKCAISSFMTGVGNVLSFIQKGHCIVKDTASFICDMESHGQTEIRFMNIPRCARILAMGGITAIDSIVGNISLLKSSKHAVLKIKQVVGSIDHIESLGTILIDQLTSDKKTIFSAKEDGKLNIAQASLLDSFIFSKDGHICFSEVDGKTTALITDRASLSMKNASFLTLVVDDVARSEIATSHIDRGYLLGDSENVFSETTASCLTNHGKMTVVDTDICRLRNTQTVTLRGSTFTQKVANNGDIKFADGEHLVEGYFGESEKSQILVAGSEEAEDIEVCDEDVVLQDKGALVKIQNILGTGLISGSNQLYRHGFLHGYRLQGNADIVLDYMPSNCELPDCSGDLRLHISMRDDFINDRDRVYKDVIFFMYMGGHDWKNVEADFIAKGLHIEDARILGNYGGRVGLRDFLEGKAEQIINTARPEVRDNGRWVHDTSNGRAHLHFYMPAEYLSQNKTTGIGSGGDMVLQAGTITNEFSTIASAGSMHMQATKEIRNKVGTVAAAEDSVLRAPEVINEDAGVTVRKGEGHARGHSGWGLWRREWHYDLYVAEVVNKSDGAQMIFGDKIAIDGSFRNIGSTLAGKRIEISGGLEQVSVLEHAAKLSTDAKVYGIGMQLWSIKEDKR